MFSNLLPCVATCRMCWRPFLVGSYHTLPDDVLSTVNSVMIHKFAGGADIGVYVCAPSK